MKSGICRSMMERIIMESQKLAQQANSPSPGRGPYRTPASGVPPKRRSAESLQKLVEKSARRGRELEIAAKSLKRRDHKIKELEQLLELANKRVLCLIGQEEDLANQYQEALDREKTLRSEADFLEKKLELFEKRVNQTPAIQKKRTF